MFSGSYVALMTPFRAGTIDEEALRNLVDFQIEQGTQGLIPVGTTGESCVLSNKEHKRVVEIVVEQCAQRIPVIAGAGSNNPAEALEYAQYAERMGADGVLCVAGYYNRPSQEGLYQHFKMIHDNTDIAMLIYNIPPRAVVDITPATMARLAKLDRVVGVKDATADLNRINAEQPLITQEFSYFSGEDGTALAYHALGGNGCISVTANVAPRLCAKLQNLCAKGNYAQARAVHRQLLPLHSALFLEPSPAGVKYAASLLGICQEQARLPIVAVSETTKKTIGNALLNLGLIDNLG
ncbi:MAG: 4-hydroxy-tetrahydrodipicolinate synthase [Oceanospirillaceae bacterium]|nr:4-hydroxy-tetrahydrodipicolinate synthase [Oceanospirillaceae bacterium]